MIWCRDTAQIINSSPLFFTGNSQTLQTTSSNGFWRTIWWLSSFGYYTLKHTWFNECSLMEHPDIEQEKKGKGKMFRLNAVKKEVNSRRMGSIGHWLIFISQRAIGKISCWSDRPMTTINKHSYSQYRGQPATVLFVRHFRAGFMPSGTFWPNFWFHREWRIGGEKKYTILSLSQSSPFNRTNSWKKSSVLSSG